MKAKFDRYAENYVNLTRLPISFILVFLGEMQRVAFSPLSNVDLSVHPYVRPSVRPSFRPSVRPSVRPTFRPSVCPSVLVFVTLVDNTKRFETNFPFFTML